MSAQALRGFDGAEGDPAQLSEHDSTPKMLRTRYRGWGPASPGSLPSPLGACSTEPEASGAPEHPPAEGDGILRGSSDSALTPRMRKTSASFQRPLRHARSSR